APGLELLVWRAAGVRCDRAKETRPVTCEDVRKEAPARVASREHPIAIDRIGGSDPVHDAFHEELVRVVLRRLEVPRAADAVGVGEERVFSRGPLEWPRLVKARAVATVAVKDEDQRIAPLGLERLRLDERVASSLGSDLDGPDARARHARVEAWLCGPRKDG